MTAKRSTRLTEKEIISAQLDAFIANKPILLWDRTLRGFGLRISPPSKKYPLGKTTYIVQKRTGGRRSREIRYTFGEYPTLSIAEAYNNALTHISQIRSNVDIAQGKKSLFAQRRQEYENYKTAQFKTIFEAYRQAKIQEKGSSAYFTKQIVNNFNKHVIPLVGNKALQEITNDDLRVILKAIPTTPMRRVVHAQLNPVFEYAIAEKIISQNPMAGIKLPAPSAPRERVLSKNEIGAFWLACDDLINSPKGKPLAGHIFRALLLSAARLNEIACLEYGEIRGDEQIIAIAARRTKNKKPFIIPITSELGDALKAIDSTRKGAKHKTYMFAYGQKPMSNFSNAKLLLDSAMKKYLAATTENDELEPFVIHSIRHTFSTVMASKGYNLEHISLCLAHTPKILQSVDGQYNHYAFIKEKRTVLEGWAKYINEAIASLTKRA